MADLTSHGDTKRSLPKDKSKPHICLIGAGISSLRCATTLIPHFKVTILESRSRIGGRVTQSHVGTHLVDLGANWIHGTVNNPILDIAKETGSSWEEADEDAAPVVFDEGGALMDETVAGKATGVFWGMIEEAMGYSEEMRETGGIDKGKSLFEWLEEKVGERVQDEDDEGKELRKVVLQMSEMWGNFVGMDVRKQSLRNFWMEEFGEGGNLFLDGTYKKIVDAVAKRVLEKADVKLNTKVVKVYGREGKEGKVKVEVQGGEVMAFDEVVVTCPLGWLKRNLSAFEPPLPERFQQAIHSINYGCLEKIMITFPEPFWKTEKDGRETKGMMQFLAPLYGKDSNPSKYMQFVMDYASMTPSSSHPTLLFYISGSQSQHLIPYLAALPNDTSRRDHLISYFRPYFSLLNGYDSASPACQPVDAISTGWLLDEDAGHGSYSCFEVGLDNGGEDVEVMRKADGLVERGVWFAGEHTHLKAIGTVTGAFKSGEAVGERLKEVYGM